MTDPDMKDLQAAIAAMAKLVSPRVRVLMLAELLDSQIRHFGGFCDETETAAALKSLLVVRAGSFSEPKKAATEAAMSRDLLPLGIKAAREKLLGMP